MDRWQVRVDPNAVWKSVPVVVDIPSPADQLLNVGSQRDVGGKAFARIGWKRTVGLKIGIHRSDPVCCLVAVAHHPGRRCIEESQQFGGFGGIIWRAENIG